MMHERLVVRFGHALQVTSAGYRFGNGLGAIERPTVTLSSSW